MGTTLAIIGLVGGIVALFAIELFISGNKSSFYQAVLIGVVVIEVIALAISLFFSAGGVNVMGTVLAVIGLAGIVVFYVYGDTKRVEDPSSTSDTRE
ncbi:hypothetical protein OS190_19975 [Sulfitobacter sp. F26204]|uniref:hypothetical protein n=1 Tax=Sulfitobacter sp. F26204 TaxID=2996014 RepID=UPI00225E0688|nr:hypothetical protein [Sulfitobacter sp. F26204]MCX7561846.1 hypothetical protein [Sulfitobacter sp. F26204]